MGGGGGRRGGVFCGVRDCLVALAVAAWLWQRGSVAAWLITLAVALVVPALTHLAYARTARHAQRDQRAYARCLRCTLRRAAWLISASLRSTIVSCHTNIISCRSTCEL